MPLLHANLVFVFHSCTIPFCVVSVHCADGPRPRDTIPQLRIFGIGDASPNADDAWAAHSRSSPRRKPPPHVPNRRPRFPTSTPPPGPSAHPSGFSIRSQRDYFGFNPTAHQWLPFVPPSPRSSIPGSTDIIPYSFVGSLSEILFGKIVHRRWSGLRTANDKLCAVHKNKGEV